ncbi:uncharacterized protein F4812DRAFT_457668 [Daldinia caldariorum]|uniref:uncharacterized protein n=1 Tax=Daldinia caldariorum TaxID=326644 RepID=UPI002008BDFC|nr:uncharacterized protein F4812DRAFT_457668 [Daldinia caldariorum]KAI1469123.1 hypothetical protein F4812DRAFT_457668 [Daldinia caldariorum]
MALISSLVVSLRVYVQFSRILFWWDDGLMLVALTIYLASVGLVWRSVQLGLGTSSTDIPKSVQVERMKYATIWSLLYTACLVAVKASICLTMLRLKKSTGFIRFAIYVLLLTSVGSFLVWFIGLLTLCHPVEASWNPSLVIEGNATCADRNTLLRIVYTSAIMTFVTDVACAVLPAVMLWNIKLKVKRLLVSLILLFGLIASICTVMRTVYIQRYAEDGIQFSTLKTVLLSNIGTGICIIIGSLPVLQKNILSYYRKRGLVISPKPPGSKSSSSVTAKLGDNREDLNNPFDSGFNITTISANRRSSDWDRTKGKLDLHVIRAEYTFEVTRSGVSTELVEIGGIK